MLIYLLYLEETSSRERGKGMTHVEKKKCKTGTSYAANTTWRQTIMREPEGRYVFREGQIPIRHKTTIQTLLGECHATNRAHKRATNQSVEKWDKVIRE